jgi:branched-chain amino acid transport system ATP-binding protein
MSKGEPVLRCVGLNCFYGKSHVVDDMSLDVFRGEAVALVGRNGMGKTTLLKGILGLVSRRATTLTLNGTDISNSRTFSIARDGLQLVPEGRGVFYNLRVGEQLKMCVALNRGVAAKLSLSDVLGIFPNLSERSNNFGDQLSGGEQQMLTIARALLLNPKCIMIDEATEGVAPIISQQIWDALVKIRSMDVALVIVDKNLSQLAKFVDRFIVVERGRKIFDGSSASFRRNSDSLKEALSF